MTKEALKLALEAFGEIEWSNNSQWQSDRAKVAITAIKEALEQPWEKFCDSNCVWTDHHPDCKLAEQEPVAWRTFDGEGGYDYRTYEENENYAEEWDKRNPKHKDWVEPLYTIPPQRKPLTDEEAQQTFAKHNCTISTHLAGILARAIEAKLKEKNT